MADTLTRSMKSLTILKLTSAERSARRTSWRPSSMLLSESRPRPESLRKTLPRDSWSESNMGGGF
jgi:hypothetical protein